ncbi:hypothetical protein CQ018_16730 [Arthrobacter sp. MYb227]|uniref:hypothetical protein n=1 Tax=Arthrobacter sp. MYb227 TaxID=1848601 RepID=UPI000CFB44EB|nr:hypothetical protein [Arthrobacter sp. MYb227]PQZ88632.1 hypothetical protein CQ018_16730 [Arthrobacter sp. MYb227]
MDNFENLMTNADPAKRNNIGGPGPLDLRDPAPVFTQNPVSTKRSKRTNGWRAFVIGTAVAAVTAGIIVWSPWQAPLDAGPAGPAIKETETPSTGSTPEDSLPNSLIPAHPSVYFEDSAACNALDLQTIKIKLADGTEEALPNNPKMFPIAGCVEGTAAIQTSDLAIAWLERFNGGRGILIAKWKDETWRILEKDNPGSIHGDGFPLLSWPQLRGMGSLDNWPIKPDQAGRIKDLGLDETIIRKLLGPDTPSWTGKFASTDFETYENNVLSMAHPGWKERELMYDSDKNQMTGQAKNSPEKAAWYDLEFSDARGKTVVSMTIADPAEIVGSDQCTSTGTYRLDGESPSGVVADAGPMKLALMTLIPSDGSAPISQVGLFPGDLPASGDDCAVYGYFVDIQGKKVKVSEWIAPMGFKNQAERDAYLNSPEYMDAQKVAASLKLKPKAG